MTVKDIKEGAKIFKLRLVNNVVFWHCANITCIPSPLLLGSICDMMGSVTLPESVIKMLRPHGWSNVRLGMVILKSCT